MKTIEFIKHLGLETEYYNHEILINDKEGRTIYSITRDQCFQFDIDYYVVKGELLNIVLQYSSTPLDERE